MGRRGLYCGRRRPLAIWAILAGTPVGGADGSDLVDAVLILGLSFGVKRRSRVCAVVLLIIWVGGKVIWSLGEGVRMHVNLLSFVLAYFFFQGARATFRHHRLVRIETATLAPAVQPTSSAGVRPG